MKRKQNRRRHETTCKRAAEPAEGSVLKPLRKLSGSLTTPLFRQWAVGGDRVDGCPFRAAGKQFALFGYPSQEERAVRTNGHLLCLVEAQCCSSVAIPRFAKFDLRDRVRGFHGYLLKLRVSDAANRTSSFEMAVSVGIPTKAVARDWKLLRGLSRPPFVDRLSILTGLVYGNGSADCPLGHLYAELFMEFMIDLFPYLQNGAFGCCACRRPPALSAVEDQERDSSQRLRDALTQRAQAGAVLEELRLQHEQCEQALHLADAAVDTAAAAIEEEQTKLHRWQDEVPALRRDAEEAYPKGEREFGWRAQILEVTLDQIRDQPRAIRRAFHRRSLAISERLKAADHLQQVAEELHRAEAACEQAQLKVRKAAALFDTLSEIRQHVVLPSAYVSSA
jgi:hypothetical protein